MALLLQKPLAKNIFIDSVFIWDCNNSIENK
jgi:hypothetical protein